MVNQQAKRENEEETYIKGIGWLGFGLGANTASVDVKDGKIVRIRPFRYDEKYEPEHMKPWKIKARGKTFEPTLRSLIPPFSMVYKQRVYSKNRILYPMKRIDWDPDGERNTQNRGKSKYVRISWDEAATLIARELKRVQKKYGPYAVLAAADGHGETKCIHGPHGCQTHLLDLMGGYTLQARNPDSWEGWYWGAKHVWGTDPVGQGLQNNLWLDCSENTEMILFWGCDPETTTWGWSGQAASRLCYWFSELGITSIYICPDFNYGAAAHADKWIPVRPNTDSALQFAIAYTWITEDLYDKEYVATHVHGFEEFKKEVMGETDKIPKTPKWAEDICGVPARIIKALARKWHKQATSIAHCNGGSYIRSTYSHEPGRLEVCLLGMQGLGKPGRNQLKMIEWQFFGLNEQMPGPRSEVIPNVAGAYHGWAFTGNESLIPKTLIPQAITTEEPFIWYGSSIAGFPKEDQFVQYKFPINEQNSTIRMIWSDEPCWTTCWNGGNRMIEALRSPKLECVVCQQPWMENDCLFADILLPINTKLEEEDISTDVYGGEFNLVYHEGRCIEPLGESKSDWEAVSEVAKKLGLYEEFTKSKSIEEWIKEGFDHSGIENMISYEEFREKSYYVIPTADGWETDPRGFGLFAEDPVVYPLDTPTGKLEFYSTDLATYFPDDKERKPVPQWIPFGESHSESLLHPRAQKYPYLIVSNHPRWRVHANLDDCAWLREIPTCKVKGPDGYLYEPVWINPIDAKNLGIKYGDVVRIHNDRGWTLGGAYVTERIMPGVIYQDHGARLDPIEPGVSDRGGANNLICPGMITSKNCAGEVTSGFLIGIEKVDINKLRAQYADAFSRPYDAASGLVIDAWLEEGK